MNAVKLFLLGGTIAYSIPQFLHWFIYQTDPPVFILSVLSISLVLFLLTSYFDKLDKKERRN
ncbi:hypothetical protein [Paludifilum halophilum]|uniref:Uncharacterized protein n=1 Tax=Paludifilum halophilum TaxID=1642702 RepID=A0A235B581_9BACL|nr:hypothetical protein [Paludifilum halophilum]OYD07468.1 hypothetical protein CHM34_11240 [Paludifilum halophilum]